jgi:trehalose 6-phosphate phosphatase
VADPLASRPAPGAVEALREISLAGATVAVVTGRPAGLVVELGGLDAIPDLVVFGSYGAQRWSGGVLTNLVLPAATLPDARAELAALVEDGITLEDKDLAVAVHTRQAADPAAVLERLRVPVASIASRYGLLLEPGSLVIEVRTPGPDKGDAMRALLPGHEAVLWAGDDHGDLPALRAVRDSGLPALCVCVAREDGSDELRQAADLVIATPAALVELLRQLTTS